MAEVIPYLFYSDVPAAIEWLATAFGFSEELRVDTPTGGIHAQMSCEGKCIMMGQPAPGHSSYASPLARGAAPSVGVFIYLDDVDAHYARAVAAGATIDMPLADESYGRTYAALDLEGHPWFFTRRPPDQAILGSN